MSKSGLTQELTVFLGLLHQEKEQEYKNYEHYLVDGEVEELEQEIQQVTIPTGDLSVIYSAPESELSTQRDNNQLEIMFHSILKDLTNGIKTMKIEYLKDCELKVKSLQKCINLHLNKQQQLIMEFKEKSTALETNNKLLIDTLQSAQCEISLLNKKLKPNEDESVFKLKKKVSELKKQYDELNRKQQHLQQNNQLLQNQLEMQANQFQQDETEFRDVSKRLIKSNQALREIIMNMGNISPLNKQKLQEVIKYLTNDNNSRGRSVSKPKSQHKENNYYSTASTQRTKQSISPSCFNSTRNKDSHDKISIQDSNSQISYKEIFQKSNRVQRLPISK